jgi:hypothetical protein
LIAEFPFSFIDQGYNTSRNLIYVYVMKKTGLSFPIIKKMPSSPRVEKWRWVRESTRDEIA